jgi:diacylglycerol kinase
MKSFRDATRGLGHFLLTEDHAFLHLLATILVFALAFILGISRTEWLVILLTVGLVWVAEMGNSCVEKIMDYLTDEKDDRIRLIKDLSAGAVLFAALVALTVGLIIFVPKL